MEKEACFFSEPILKRAKIPRGKKTLLDNNGLNM